MIKQYMPEHVRECYQFLDRPADIKKHLGIMCVPDARVVICPQEQAYGVFDANGGVVPESVHVWGGTHRLPRKTASGRVPYYDMDAIYCGGGCFFHFGHFLLQGLTRIWPRFQNKYKNMKCVFVTEDKKFVMPGYAKQLLKFAGLHDDDIMVLDHSAIFRRLYIPQQSFHLNQYSSAYQVELYSTIARICGGGVEKNSVDKIYLSRTKLGAQRTYGEETVQHIFEKNGFRIIYPETMSVADQVACVKNCKILAGCAGTALHLAAFMKPGGTVIQIKRNSSVDDSSFPQNLINQTNKLNFVTIWGSVEARPSKHNTNIPQIIGVTPYMRKFFDDYGFDYNENDLTHAPEILEAYDRAMGLYRARTKYTKLKKSVAKILSRFIPGRKRRHDVYECVKRFLKTYDL